MTIAQLFGGAGAGVAGSAGVTLGAIAIVDGAGSR